MDIGEDSHGRELEEVLYFGLVKDLLESPSLGTRFRHCVNAIVHVMLVNPIWKG